MLRLMQPSHYKKQKIKSMTIMLVAYAFLCYCCLMQGLITKNRKGLNPAVAPFARGHGPNEVQDLHEGASLVEVVW
jgi:hypothetical protein